jgi:chaperonin GroEL
MEPSPGGTTEEIAGKTLHAMLLHSAAPDFSTREDRLVYRPNIDHQRCFVLLPLRAPFLGYFEKIIKPAALEAGLIAIKADDIYGTRAVISDIWELIWTSKVAIAIVTGKNPNVNYELGICHTLGVPTILVTEKADDVPFDYRHRRYVVYKTKEAGWEQKLREDLRNTMKALLVSPEKDEKLRWPYNTFDLQRGTGRGELVPASDSLELVMRGTQAVRDSVAAAFGPHGGPVSVILPNKTQSALRKGYAIAHGIRVGDALGEQGAEHMRRLASEVASSVGDATKTAILLSCSLIEGGVEALRTGSIAKFLVAGMQKAIDAARTHVVTEAKQVEEQHLPLIAQTATGSDEKLAAIVVEAMKKVGRDGVVEVAAGTGPESGLSIQEGMQFDTGFLSPSFVTDSQREECILEDACVLLYEGQVQSMMALLPILELVARAGKPILVIASDMAQEALATLIVNKERGTLACAAVKAPGQGDRRRAILEDIATLTGGRAFLLDRMRPLEDATLNDLGRAKKIIACKNGTIIIGGGGKPQAVRERIQGLRHQIDSTSNLYDAAKLRERLARLVGAIAVIRSGGATDSERADNRYKLESALFSCQSAIENGYVVGGGICLYRAKRLVEKLVAANDSEQRGIAAVSRALEAPLRCLIKNSSVNKPKALAEIAQPSRDTTGFNAETERIEDLEEAGILDAARALDEALVLAFAHAKGILITGLWHAPGEKASDEQEIEFEHPDTSQN